MKDFYPRPPRGGRPKWPSVTLRLRYFYPRPPRGGRLRWRFPSPRSSYFYPRPPRGGRRVKVNGTLRVTLFLSTPSARRATSVHRCSISGHIYFYPRPPRGGRPWSGYPPGCYPPISIHALREEGDRQYPARWPRLRHFYPRPPRGGRRVSWQCQERNRPFLSTPSARRATVFCIKDNRRAVISIHALREEGDHGVDGAERHRDISIHALREEGDVILAHCFKIGFISIHALREEGDYSIPGLIDHH